MVTGGRAGAAPLPTLGLALTGSGAPLLPLLAALRSWCRPVSLRSAEDGAPVAVLADHVPAVEPAVPWAVVSPDPAVVEAAGERGHLTPDGAVDTGVAFVPPFVRERLRAARGLPARPVLRVGGDPHRGGSATWDGTVTVPADLLDTALAGAAVVVVDTPAPAERALAWGAPLVCPPVVADALGVGAGLRDGADAVLVLADDPDADLTALAADVRRLARLSWRGRRWWEQRHDPALLAARLAVDLLPSTPLAAQVRLAELGTRSAAHVRDRLREAGG